MSDSWKSKSEGDAVSIPMPSESGDGNKHADVDEYSKQCTHGKFDAGDWDPSSSGTVPTASGWDSRSEGSANDGAGHPTGKK